MNYSEALCKPTKAVGGKKCTNESISVYGLTLFTFFINSGPAPDVKLVDF